MILTEDEARKRWCPFAPERYAYSDGKEALPQGGRTTQCIASECMAWRWERRFERVITDLDTSDCTPETDKVGYAGRIVKPDGEGWREDGMTANGRYIWIRDLPAIRGFCGLAGKP